MYGLLPVLLGLRMHLLADISDLLIGLNPLVFFVVQTPRLESRSLEYIDLRVTDALLQLRFCHDFKVFSG